MDRKDEGVVSCPAEGDEAFEGSVTPALADPYRGGYEFCSRLLAECCDRLQPIGMKAAVCVRRYDQLPGRSVDAGLYGEFFVGFDYDLTCGQLPATVGIVRP